MNSPLLITDVDHKHERISVSDASSLPTEVEYALGLALANAEGRGEEYVRKQAELAKQRERKERSSQIVSVLNAAETKEFLAKLFNYEGKKQVRVDFSYIEKEKLQVYIDVPSAKLVHYQLADDYGVQVTVDLEDGGLKVFVRESTEDPEYRGYTLRLQMQDGGETEAKIRDFLLTALAPLLPTVPKESAEQKQLASIAEQHRQHILGIAK